MPHETEPMSRVYVLCRLEPKEATPRKRAASTTASGKPRAKRASASRQRLIEAELQELDRLDREMRGEIRSRKLRTTLTPQERPAARSRVKEMVKQAQNIWDQIYSEVRTGRGGSSVPCVVRKRGVEARCHHAMRWTVMLARAWASLTPVASMS